MKDYVVCKILRLIELYFKVRDLPTSAPLDEDEYNELQELERQYIRDAHHFVHAKHLRNEELNEAEFFFWENEQFSMASYAAVN